VPQRQRRIDACRAPRRQIRWRSLVFAWLIVGAAPQHPGTTLQVNPLTAIEAVVMRLTADPGAGAFAMTTVLHKPVRRCSNEMRREETMPMQAAYSFAPDPSMINQPIPWYLMHRVREGNDPYAVDEPMPEFLMHRIVEHNLNKHNHDPAYIDMVHRVIIEIYSQPDSRDLPF
jgi:hypothetical protein